MAAAKLQSMMTGSAVVNSIDSYARPFWQGCNCYSTLMPASVPLNTECGHDCVCTYAPQCQALSSASVLTYVRTDKCYGASKSQQQSRHVHEVPCMLERKEKKRLRLSASI